MRHSRVINHLGRTSSHRKSMLSNMAASLIMHKRITTTTAKAKALRTYVEPIITKSKDDSTHSRREVFSFLKDKEAVAELFREISPKIAERPGGYTRILKTGKRIGDNADMCILELVDYNEAMMGKSDAAKTKTTRRRKAPAKKKTEAEGVEKTKEKVAEKAPAEAETKADEKAAEEEK
jgi:large subunit ribosomal protein L17